MKRFGKTLFLGILSVLTFLFGTIGCEAIPVLPDNTDTLSAVEQSSIIASLDDSRLTVEWGAVDRATMYLVTHGDMTQLIEAPTTRAVFPGVDYVSGTLTVSIVARAPGLKDSAATTYTFTPGENPPAPPGPNTLATPTGLIVSGGTLTWSVVLNATSYTVSDGTKTVTVNTNSIDLASSGLAVPTSGSVTYRVVAKASGFTDSNAASYKYTVGGPPQPQTLATPTGLAVNSGKLTWMVVPNATSYTVSDGTKTVTVTTNNIDLAANGLTVPTSGSITYTVVAKASGYTDSTAASYKYTPSVTPPAPTTLAMPTGLIVSGGWLMWTSVANATSYVVSDGTKTVTVNTTNVNLSENGFSTPSDVTVTYTVVAKATGYNDSPAASCTHTFDHTHSFSEGWENSETHHWHPVTCGHSLVIEDQYAASYSAHEFGDGDICSVCSYQRPTPVLGKYVMFGEYPQSLKDDSVTVGGSADAKGYYTGSDGAKYVKVTATPYVYYQGFRTKFSNGEWITTGAEYYFKVEPIKWRVLTQESGEALIFCDSIIDHGAYYSSVDNREIDGVTVYPSNYKNSDIRAWLNGTFYSAAFSSSEQSGIKITTVDNSAATTGLSTNTYVCENTQDKVFLLSNKDMYNTSYGFIADGTESDSARMLLVSDYARAIGAHTSDSIVWAGCGIWWARSPMHDDATVVDSGSMSGMVSSSKVTSAQVGIAPAMRVSASAVTII